MITNPRQSVPFKTSAMFEELYYWMYLNLRKMKSNNMPAFNAYILICLLQIFNLGTLAVIINYFFKINIDRNLAICTGIGLAFLLAVINRILLYNERETIFKKYEKNLPGRKVKGQIYLWLYVLLSFVAYFVSVANLVTPKY